MNSNNSPCLDAATALAFALADEPLHAQAVALFQAFALQSVTFCAPALFAYECDSVIRLRVYKKALTPAQAQKARAVIDALPVRIEYDATDRARAFGLAEQYDQPRAYDAAYAAHAEARGAELITIDEPFSEAVNGSKRPKAAPVLSYVKLLK